MAIVYHQNLFVTVKRHGEHLISESVHLSQEAEAVAWIKCRANDLAIEQAGFARYRSLRDPVSYDYFPQLIGIKAHLQAGPALKQGLGEQYQGLCASLLAECIRGIVQAETFIYRERGFASITAYNTYWEEMYLNSCRYYSHLDRIKTTWMDHVGTEIRQRHLYHRSQAISVTEKQSDLKLLGVFMDSFHEIHIDLDLAPDGIIKDSNGRIVRAPDAVCFENKAHIASFKGQNLLDLHKKDIAGIAGGPQGCVHLVDLLHSMATAAITLNGPG